MVKKTALLHMIRSSLVVALLPLTVIILLTQYMMANVESREELLYQTASNAMCSLVEHTVTTAENAAYTISKDATLAAYLSENAQNYWKERQLMTVLSNSICGLQYIDDCFVYVRDLDRIISIKGNHAPAFYFSELSRLDWDGILAQTAEGYSYFLSYGDDVLCSIAGVYNSSDASVGFCTIVLDLDTMMEGLHAAFPQTADRFALFCNDFPIASSLEPSALSAFRDDSGLLLQPEATLEDRKYFLSQCTISGEVFSVILGRTGQGVAAELWANTVFIIWIACFVLTILLSLFLSYRSYRPLKKISAIAHEKNPALSIANANEYTIIEESLLSFEQQIKWLSQKIKIQNDMFRNFYLEKLMLGQITSFESVKDIMSFFGMSFYHRHNFICYADVDLTQRQIDEYSDTDLLAEEEIVANLHELLTEALHPEEYLYRLQLNHKQVFVCSVFDADAYQAEITQIARTMAQGASCHIELYFGSSVDCAEKLSESYQQMLSQIGSDELNDDARFSTATSTEKGGNDHIQYSDQCIDMIHNRYSDEGLNAEALAKSCGVTLSYLSRTFKKEVGMGLLEYLQRYRINCAKRLLAQDPALRINSLCESVGYPNAATFIRVFKKYEGISPGVYRDELLQSGR